MNFEDKYEDTSIACLNNSLAFTVELGQFKKWIVLVDHFPFFVPDLEQKQ